MNNKLVKIIGAVSGVVGIVASIATNWSNEKQLDAKIASKVAEAVTKISKED